MAAKKSTKPAKALIRIVTRGSALALAQTHIVESHCRAQLRDVAVEVQVLKTTGDKLQTAALANPGGALPKGLFTKELEVALLEGSANLAVHSLKDLPTELPEGLQLGAVLKRADPRDVLIVRAASMRVPGRGSFFGTLGDGACVATSSTRRRVQLLARRPDLRVVEIRGNVGTRLRKVAEEPGVDATILAAAGMDRLGFVIGEDGVLRGDGVPEDLVALPISFEEMLPCVGQAAIAIETRVGDELAAKVCSTLDNLETHWAVDAERAFLRGMGGGCQSPVGAYARVEKGRLELRAVAYQGGVARHGYVRVTPEEAEEAGMVLAAQLKAS